MGRLAGVVAPTAAITRFVLKLETEASIAPSGANSPGVRRGVAAARRTVAVAQNATVKFTLPVPCVGQGSYGKLEVYRDGRLVRELGKTVSLPDVHSGGTPRPALLVVSPHRRRL